MMQAKGFARGSVNPDLLINLGMSVTDEVQTRDSFATIAISISEGIY